ncbi:MAG TPA: hypothetical protein VMR44_05810 [Thermoanaerobaculia bacterium]|nr:hypothetical protein [Thermoanaerobaculia bacterium]
MGAVTRRRPAFKPKECATCGTEFEPRSGRQKFCSPGGCQAEPEAAGGLVELEPEAQVVAEPSEEELVAQVEAAVRLNAEALRGGRGFRDPAWQFVVELRKLPEWAGIGEDEAVKRCERAFGTLYRRGNGKGSELPFSTGYTAEQHAWMKRRFPEAERGGWVCALGAVDSEHALQDADPDEDFADPLEAFLRAWRNVRSEPSAFDAALHRARQPFYWDAVPGYLGRDEPALGPGTMVPRRAKYREFLAVCREMSRAAEDGVFALPTRFWADRLNTDRRTIAGWRKEAEGYLELVERETPHGYGRARAARYRWIWT